MKKKVAFILVAALAMQGTGLHPMQTIRSGISRVTNPMASFLSRYIGRPAKAQIDNFLDWSAGLFTELNNARKAGKYEAMQKIKEKYRAMKKGAPAAIIMILVSIIIGMLIQQKLDETKMKSGQPRGITPTPRAKKWTQPKTTLGSLLINGAKADKKGKLEMLRDILKSAVYYEMMLKNKTMIDDHVADLKKAHEIARNRDSELFNITQLLLDFVTKVQQAIASEDSLASEDSFEDIRLDWDPVKTLINKWNDEVEMYDYEIG